MKRPSRVPLAKLEATVRLASQSMIVQRVHTQVGTGQLLVQLAHRESTLNRPAVLYVLIVLAAHTAMTLAPPQHHVHEESSRTKLTRFRVHPVRLDTLRLIKDRPHVLNARRDHFVPMLQLKNLAERGHTLVPVANLHVFRVLREHMLQQQVKHHVINVQREASALYHL